MVVIVLEQFLYPSNELYANISASHLHLLFENFSRFSSVNAHLGQGLFGKRNYISNICSFIYNELIYSEEGTGFGKHFQEHKNIPSVIQTHSPSVEVFRSQNNLNQQM
jgi:hypothetical protein